MDYYNDLDTKIGKELSGFDVIDDLECEQIEILQAGNNFFVYSEQIHIARMAGCFSIVADLMDEKKLSSYHAWKLCNELCGIQSKDVPYFTNRKHYIQHIKTVVDKKSKVYDYKNRAMSPIINVHKLDQLIWLNEPAKDNIEYAYKLIAGNQVVSFVIVVCILFYFIVYIR